MSNLIIDLSDLKPKAKRKQPSPKQIANSDPFSELDPIHGPVKPDTRFDVPIDSTRTDLYKFLKSPRK